MTSQNSQEKTKLLKDTDTTIEKDAAQGLEDEELETITGGGFCCFSAPKTNENQLQSTVMNEYKKAEATSPYRLVDGVLHKVDEAGNLVRVKARI